MVGFYGHMEISLSQTIVIIFRIRIGLRVAREKEWKKDSPAFTLQFRPVGMLTFLLSTNK